MSGGPGPVKVCEKSRRVGISWAEAADDALYSARESGDDTWHIGYNQDMAREFIGDAAFWAKYYQMAVFQMDKGVAKVPDKASTGEKGARRHGDAAIALALAHYARRLDAIVYEYHRVNLRETTPGQQGRQVNINAGL